MFTGILLTIPSSTDGSAKDSCTIVLRATAEQLAHNAGVRETLNNVVAAAAAAMQSPGPVGLTTFGLSCCLTPAAGQRLRLASDSSCTNSCAKTNAICWLAKGLWLEQVSKLQVYLLLA